MYSNKENVNILTSLLIVPIVHNLNECEEITCYPVTDERSAGFQAIGLSMADGCQPVVVCVTSGSALLNLYPAVAEAYYQQVPLIVISADRPAQWIGQMDGQTLPQPHALGEMVRKAVSLPALVLQPTRKRGIAGKHGERQGTCPHQCASLGAFVQL